MKKINILVCAHKHDEHTRNDDVFKAVQAGKAVHPELDLGYLCDNYGDNISELNPFWSELTVLYWGWKNIHDVEYCGLNHYRRYFDAIIDENNIDGLMKDCDMLVVKSNSMLSNHERERNLMHMTSIEDYYVFADTFLSMYPEYESAYIEYFYKSRKSFPFQMFIAKKTMYDDYCQFMFPVLFEVERRIKPHAYTRQKRTMGYFGEWFLGLYIYCKGIKTKELPILDYSCIPDKESFKSKMLLSLKKIAHVINDALYKPPVKLSVPASVRNGLKQDGIVLRYI